MEDIDIIDLATIAPLPATSAPATPSAAPEAVIRVRDLVVGFGDKLIMNGLNLDIYRG
jgi:phospholipid/cholesterol/gamma-HCH transport system ATP-binding protein